MKRSAAFIYLFAFNLLLFCTPVSNAQTTGGTSKPNILIIMADDLDSRQLSCYGGQNIQTVNIDKLASEGLKCNQVIASEAMCVPTRASLFTGLFPARNGAYQNHKQVYPGLKSVAYYLNDLGYTVALTGKDHVTKPASIFPFKIIKGFEPDCVAKTDDYSLDSIKALISNKEKPFCLFVISINPHMPWTMGNPSEFDAARLKLPLHWIDTELSRNAFCKYLAEVRRLDDQVGDVMNLLKETGQEQNTIVIFLGEQGPQFPGGKWTLYDYGQKSSMIVKWPGVIKPATETSAIIQYEDITPTLIDIAGGKPISGLDGYSFLDVLLAKSAKHRNYAFGIHNNIPEGPAFAIRSIRSAQYKLIMNLEPDSSYYIKYMMKTSDTSLPWTTWIDAAKTDAKAKALTDRIVHHPAIEFYDLEKDPYELNNLANDKQYRPLIGQYKTELIHWMEQQGDRGKEMDVPPVNSGNTSK